MLPKLAAFDIDGTLVSQNLPNTSPSPRTVQALLDLKKQGVIIVMQLATNRTHFIFLQTYDAIR